MSLLTRRQVGFFAEAGPVQVFVSSYVRVGIKALGPSVADFFCLQLIPEDMAFSALDEPCYISTDEQVRIQKNSEVRLRIVGSRNDANEIVRRQNVSWFHLFSLSSKFCVGSIKDNYLGRLGGGDADDMV